MRLSAFRQNNKNLLYFLKYDNTLVSSHFILVNSSFLRFRSISIICDEVKVKVEVEINK